MTYKKMIIGNWKMHGRMNECRKLLADLCSGFTENSNVEVAIAVPFLYFTELYKQIGSSGISLVAQDVSRFEHDGAYTGEISANMLLDVNVKYVLIGHSERRGYFFEGNIILSKKYVAATNATLVPIFCVGETLLQRKSGQTKIIIRQQLEVLLDSNSPELIVAYEPIWAIGTGTIATYEQIAETHAFIKEWVLQNLVRTVNVRVLYGGSVNADNASGLLSIVNVDGVLVGGASINANEFLSIIANVHKN